MINLAALPLLRKLKADDQPILRGLGLDFFTVERLHRKVIQTAEVLTVSSGLPEDFMDALVRRVSLCGTYDSVGAMKLYAEAADELNAAKAFLHEIAQDNHITLLDTMTLGELKVSKLFLVDATAGNTLNMAVPTTELSILVNHLEVFRDVIRSQVRFNEVETSMERFFEVEAKKLRKRLIAFLTPKGTWSEKHLLELWSRGFIIEKPPTPSPFFTLKVDDVVITVNFNKGMY